MLQRVRETRSVRRFDEAIRVTSDKLHYMVEVARLTASARNLQPLKYVTVTDEGLCAEIFECLGWAGAISDGKPICGERPTAYVLMYNDKSIAPNSLWDQGITSYAMMLAAKELGVEGCIIATIHRDKMPDLSLSSDLEPVLVLALGYPKEEVCIVEPVEGSVKYFRDENRVHYVPKRTIQEILIKEL